MCNIYNNNECSSEFKFSLKIAIRRDFLNVPLYNVIKE